MWDIGGWDAKKGNSKERNRWRQGNYGKRPELFEPGQNRVVVAGP